MSTTTAGLGFHAATYTANNAGQFQDPESISISEQVDIVIMHLGSNLTQPSRNLRSLNLSNQLSAIHPLPFRGERAGVRGDSLSGLTEMRCS
jgi:hypothetical protein